MNNYKCRCPQTPGKKRSPTGFQILRYKEEVRQEESVIFDGIHEMMSCRHYVYWMGKAKNGSQDPDEANADWIMKSNAPNAIVDNLGVNRKDKQRVAIRKADIVKFRDAQHKSNGYELQSKDQKAPTQEHIDKFERQMQDGMQSNAAASMNRWDMGKSMVAAHGTASVGDGDGDVGVGGAFGPELSVPKTLMLWFETHVACLVFKPKPDPPEGMVDCFTVQLRFVFCFGNAADFKTQCIQNAADAH